MKTTSLGLHLSVLIWRSPSCILSVCPEGPPVSQCPPIPGGTVMAWVTPSRRGELYQSSVVCVMCSRLLCPYLVCFLSLFRVIYEFIRIQLCLSHYYDYLCIYCPVCSV